MKNNNQLKLERAQKRLDALKAFYNHLVVYVVVNIALFVFRGKIIFTLININAIGNPDFLKWVDWNIYGTPIIWGIVLLIHAISVFSIFPKLLYKWEEKQMQKIMKEE